MLRYVLALLLINACYHSSGLPAERTTKFVANSLLELAKKCENPFLSNQIKSKIKDCSVPAPPYSEKQFQCLLFYDINGQLCSAVTNAKLALDKDYTTEITEEQDVNTLCESAKEWVFSNLTEYPDYLTDVGKVIKESTICGKLCAAEELLSRGANDYCKYFKWGWQMLKSPAVATQKNNASATVPPEAGVKLDNTAEASAPANKESLDIAIKSASEKTKVTESSSAVTPDKTNDLNNEVAKPIIPVEATPDNKQVPQAVDLNADKIEAVPDKSVPLPVDKAVPDKNQEVEKEIERPEAAKDVPKTGNEEQIPSKDAEHENEDKKIQKQIPQDIVGDYPGNDLESEEGKEGLMDMQGGDDGEDPELSNDIKPDQVPNKDQKLEPMGSSFSRDMSQKEFYPSTIQDGFSEDDDHFFTFFLTAVIMVILLYILYHNKNKVSQLFFGLMVEGRQAGRRRNSRGHSYRRLDTLEQAMNTNTAAPPSKIIY